MIFLQYNIISKVEQIKVKFVKYSLFIIYQDAAKLVKITKKNKNNHIFNL